MMGQKEIVTASIKQIVLFLIVLKMVICQSLNSERYYDYIVLKKKCKRFILKMRGRIIR